MARVVGESSGRCLNVVSKYKVYEDEQLQKYLSIALAIAIALCVLVLLLLLFLERQTQLNL